MSTKKFIPAHLMHGDADPFVLPALKQVIDGVDEYFEEAIELEEARVEYLEDEQGLTDEAVRDQMGDEHPDELMKARSFCKEALNGFYVALEHAGSYEEQARILVDMTADCFMSIFTYNVSIDAYDRLLERLELFNNELASLHQDAHAQLGDGRHVEQLLASRRLPVTDGLFKYMELSRHAAPAMFSLCKAYQLNRGYAHLADGDLYEMALEIFDEKYPDDAPDGRFNSREQAKFERIVRGELKKIFAPFRGFLPDPIRPEFAVFIMHQLVGQCGDVDEAGYEVGDEELAKKWVANIQQASRMSQLLAEATGSATISNVAPITQDHLPHVLLANDDFTNYADVVTTPRFTRMARQELQDLFQRHPDCGKDNQALIRLIDDYNQQEKNISIY